MKRSLGVAVATLLLAFNMLVVPVGIANAYVGESTWRPNPDDSVTIFFQGVANDSVNLHWSVVDKPGHWLNTTDTPMVYSPQNGNFSVTIGPFSKGTTIEWVFYDVTSGHWYNLNSKAYGNWSYKVGTPIPGRELVRMSVYTDKYTYSPRDLLGVTVQVTDLQAQELDGLTINSTIYDSNSVRVLQLPVITDAKLGSLASEKFNLSADISLADANYVIVSTASMNLTQVGTANVPLVVLDTAGRAPLTLALVFHMHQPIYLSLQGQFEQPWVQVHSGSDFVYNGSWYGAYLWHVVMLERHPGIKVTFNLQPSLLYQWNASMYDFRYDGTYPGGEAALSRDLVAVNATVQGYRSLAAAGRIEILTSPFYHPLSAILVNLGWSSDLQAQIGLGKNYTKAFMGVDAQGMWTPEMGFTMGMVPILENSGIKYTVLDGDNHFLHATGPSASSMFQPFELDGANGSHVIVLFRDTQISDDLVSNWNSQVNPRVAASDFMASVANVYRKAPGGVLTIASDGENPIALADGVVSALDFDSIYGAIESQSWLQTSTLGSILAQRNVTAKLTYVPDGSWSGGFGLWIGSLPKDAIWHAIIQSRGTLVNLTKQYGSSNPEIRKLWNYLYVAEGSDWEWQTPSGPAWFAMQGYRYADAAATYQAQTTTTTSQTSGFATSGWSDYALPLAGAAAATVVILSLLVVWRRRRR
ncbi:MAG: hypothetical protein ABSB29_07330 [Nitrososphaerales archaeon]